MNQSPHYTVSTDGRCTGAYL
uniref:Uncharacterized protein n=1 Tax=Anguilla anguilla TaxID=7936 RepID=A0A0E9V1D5_ANGAN